MLNADEIARRMAAAPPAPGFADVVRIPIRLIPGDQFTVPGSKLRVKVPPRETNTIVRVFGATWIQEDGEWEVPATRAQLWQLARLFQGRTDADESVKILADIWADEAEEQEKVRSYHGNSLLALGPDRKPHQAQGSLFFDNVSGLLADEPGLGKTLQAIDWMQAAGHGLHLVATTKSTKLNWAIEIERWWPEAHVYVMPSGPVGKRREAIAEAFADAPFGPVVLITAHGQLPMHSRQQALPGRKLKGKAGEPKELNDMRFASMVIDEAHKLRGYDSTFRAAALVLGRQTRLRLALTGTPKERSDDDLWAIMSWVEPDEWGERDSFRRMYCTIGHGWAGPTNLGIKPGLRPEVDQILMPRYLRRLKTDVLDDLPEKWPAQWRIVSLAPAQQKIYDALVQDYGVMINGEMLVEANAATLQGRLLQVSAGVPVVEEGKVVALAKPSPKLDEVLDILDDGGDEPLVVYTYSRKFAELLGREIEAAGYTVGMLTGKQTEKQRQKTVEAFQDGDLQVVVGTLGSGAEGITLHRANRIVLAELHWLASRNDQAIDRIHRIGQSRGVQPIILVTEGTVDVTKAMVHLHRVTDAQSLLRDPGRFEDALRGSWDLAQAIKDHNR